MKYTIEIDGLETGDIKTTIRSNARISEEDLAKIIDVLMGCFGITGKDKVVDFLSLVCATAAQYEGCPFETIRIDVKKMKEQQEEENGNA